VYNGENILKKQNGLMPYNEKYSILKSLFRKIVQQLFKIFIIYFQFSKWRKQNGRQSNGMSGLWNGICIYSGRARILQRKRI